MFECHITIDPVLPGPLREEAEELAAHYEFKLANLLMVREDGSEEPSKRDTFMTGHGQHYGGLYLRMCALINRLRESGFCVRRYKIEAILIDSKYQNDPEGLLKGEGNVHY